MPSRNTYDRVGKAMKDGYKIMKLSKKKKGITFITGYMPVKDNVNKDAYTTLNSALKSIGF